MVNVAARNELPVCFQTEHTAYLSGAFPLCIILADERNIPWFYSRYVHLYALDRRAYGQSTYIDFADSLTCSDALQTSAVSREEAGKITSLVQFTKDAVGAGVYSIVFTDDAYLRGKQEPFVHEFLVYGHDEQSREVMCVGLGNPEKGLKKFGPLRFGYDTFETAFQRALEIISPKGRFNSIANPIHLVKPGSTSAEFDLSKLAAEIQDYLECKTVDVMRARQRYWWWLTPSVAEHPAGLPISSGLDVYDRILEHIAEVGSGTLHPDYRQFHVLWEHKVAVCRRIERLVPMCVAYETLTSTLTRCRSRAAEFRALRMRILLSRRGTMDAEGVKFGLKVVQRARVDEADDLARVHELLCRAVPEPFRH